MPLLSSIRVAEPWTPISVVALIAIVAVILVVALWLIHRA